MVLEGFIIRTLMVSTGGTRICLTKCCEGLLGKYTEGKCVEKIIVHLKTKDNIVYARFIS